jgi:hypothetical protein
MISLVYMILLSIKYCGLLNMILLVSMISLVYMILMSIKYDIAGIYDIVSIKYYIVGIYNISFY